MTTKFPLKMSERAFVCQLTLLIIDTYSNILIESPINTNEMYSSVNEKRIYVIDITFGINESIFSGNEQQKVYFCYLKIAPTTMECVEIPFQSQITGLSHQKYSILIGLKPQPSDWLSRICSCANSGKISL